MTLQAVKTILHNGGIEYYDAVICERASEQ